MKLPENALSQRRDKKVAVPPLVIPAAPSITETIQAHFVEWLNHEQKEVLRLLYERLFSTENIIGIQNHAGVEQYISYRVDLSPQRGYRFGGEVYDEWNIYEDGDENT